LILMRYVLIARRNSNSARLGWEQRRLYNVPFAEESLSSTRRIPKRRQYESPEISQTDCGRQAVMVSRKRGRTMMKIGDRFKDKITGKVYIIRMETDNDTVFLEGENGLGRKLTGKKSLKRTCEKIKDGES
jgi:hypothetical protein